MQSIVKINIIYPQWVAFMTGYNEVLSEEIAAIVAQTDNEYIISEALPIDDAEFYIIVAQYREEVRSKWMRDVCKNIKGLKRCIIAVCGKAATESRIYLLKYVPEIDFVIKGEVEEVLLSLLKLNNFFSDWNKVKGISHVLEEKVFENEDQNCILSYDSLPMPKYEYLK